MESKYTLFVYVCLVLFWAWIKVSLILGKVDSYLSSRVSWLTKISQRNLSSSYSTNDQLVDPKYHPKWSCVTQFWIRRGSGDNWPLNMKDRALWGGTLLLLSFFHWKYMCEDKMFGALEVMSYPTCWRWQSRKWKSLSPGWKCWTTAHNWTLSTFRIFSYKIAFLYCLSHYCSYILFLAGKIIVIDFLGNII